MKKSNKPSFSLALFALAGLVFFACSNEGGAIDGPNSGISSVSGNGTASYCMLDGICYSDAPSEEACLLADGIPVEFCESGGGSSSSSVYVPPQSSSSVRSSSSLAFTASSSSRAASSSSRASSSSAAALSSSRAASSSSTGSSYIPTAPGNASGVTTQYWDACKPSCSWTGNAGGKVARNCNIDGSNRSVSDQDQSSCQNGQAFACMNQAPWKVGNVSFGYVAVNNGACGDCFQLDFPNGEVMVVMKSNIGNINGEFDIMIPGGGVGDFNALTRQVQNSGISNPDMGVQYGGFRGACGWSGPTVAECVRQRCNSVFANLPDLKNGCLWYVNTLGSHAASFDNANVKYKQVTCPKELTDRY